MTLRPHLLFQETNLVSLRKILFRVSPQCGISVSGELHGIEGGDGFGPMWPSGPSWSHRVGSWSAPAWNSISQAHGVEPPSRPPVPFSNPRPWQFPRPAQVPPVGLTGVCETRQIDAGHPPLLPNSQQPCVLWHVWAPPPQGSSLPHHPTEVNAGFLAQALSLSWWMLKEADL